MRAELRFHCDGRAGLGWTLGLFYREKWFYARLALLLCCSALPAEAQPNTPLPTNSPLKESNWPKTVEPPEPGETTLSAMTNTPLRMVEPGIFEIGKVRLDQRKRCITLSALLNRDKGPMEYFLVTTYGKTHESILATEAQPFHIHLAMLLLGAEGSGNAAFPGSPTNGVPGPVIHPSRETIPGQKVTITVKWSASGAAVNHSAEEIVYKNDDKEVMPRGNWVYNGSLIVHNRFLAQMDGSIISLVTDPVALVNYIGPGHDNDLIWEPNAANLPPPGVPVEVTLTLPEAPAKP